MGREEDVVFGVVVAMAMMGAWLGPAGSEVAIAHGSWVATATAASASAAKSCVVFVVRPIITSAGVSLRGRAPASLLPLVVYECSGPPPNLPVLTAPCSSPPVPRRCWPLSLGADGWALWGPGTSLPPNPEACLVFLVGPPPGT